MTTEEDHVAIIEKNLKRYPDLTVTQYSGVAQWCQEAIDRNHDFLYDVALFEKALQDACARFQTQLPSLQSLMRNSHVWHVKITTRRVKAAASSRLDDYVNKGMSMWEIAKTLRYPPYLLARHLLEEMTTIPRKGLTEVMRNPLEKLCSSSSVLRPEYQASERFLGPASSESTTNTTRLAREIMHVIDMDPMYGPTHDEARHTIGVEYERVLEKLLTNLGIPFETEEQLRQKGTSRTPDVLLSTPCAVKMNDSSDDEWRIICWIDSKALFGDAHTHKDSVIPQAESYIHRFGPGLLLYWFGHAPRLETAHGDLVLCGWTLPDRWLLPTGEEITNTAAAAYPATL